GGSVAVARPLSRWSGSAQTTGRRRRNRPATARTCPPGTRSAGGARGWYSVRPCRAGLTNGPMYLAPSPPAARSIAYRRPPDTPWEKATRSTPARNGAPAAAGRGPAVRYAVRSSATSATGPAVVCDKLLPGEIKLVELKPAIGTANVTSPRDRWPRHLPRCLLAVLGPDGTSQTVATLRNVDARSGRVF